MIHKAPYEKPQSEIVWLAGPTVLKTGSNNRGEEFFYEEIYGVWEEEQ
jgi:hypothetical protein